MPLTENRWHTVTLLKILGWPQLLTLQSLHSIGLSHGTISPYQTISDLSCNTICLLLKVVDARISINYIYSKSILQLTNNPEHRQICRIETILLPFAIYTYTITNNIYTHKHLECWTRSHNSTCQIITCTNIYIYII